MYKVVVCVKIIVHERWMNWRHIGAKYLCTIITTGIDLNYIVMN